PDPSRRLATFVWSLTRGHAWGVDKVFTALAELGARQRELAEADVTSVLEAKCPGDPGDLKSVAVKYLLLTDVPRKQDEVVTWALARDAATAEACLAGTAGLQAEVAPWCWLSVVEGQAQQTSLVLHPWVRRLLVAQAPSGGSSWSDVYRELLAYQGNSPVDRGYYELALGNLTAVVTDLNRRFDELADVNDWITEFETITSAPHEPAGRETALARHSRLKRDLLDIGPTEHPRHDPHDERWLTVVDLTVARWVWSDPLCDPTLQMNSIIANGYRDLARRSPRGQLRLIAMAEFYANGGRP
ncbi:MAG TPA: hypothetical protein VFU98_01555, partial [Microlunatus sp.]|nr:hypothetical protein [Microlunatus sp.]